MFDLTGAFKANQTAQEVRGNNIVIAEALGARKADVQFSPTYNDKTGAGVETKDITYSMKTGKQISTDSALALSIEGKGYFILAQDEGNPFYTRVGKFGLDKNGFLIKDNLKVQGYSINADGEVNTGKLNDIKINRGFKPAKATDTLTTIGSLNKTKAAPSIAFDATDESSYSFKRLDTVFDSDGEKHDFFQYFVRDAADSKKWTVHYQLNNQGAGTANLAFDDNGKISPADFTATTNALQLANAQPITINIDYTNLTLSIEASNLGGSSANGYASSEYKDVKIDEMGVVYTEYADGQSLSVGKIVLANFAVEEALTPSANGTNWQHNNQSGNPILSTLEKNSTKQIKSNQLAGSNIDVKDELIGLMNVSMHGSALASLLTTVRKNNETLMHAIG